MINQEEKVTFKFQLGVRVKCRVTDYVGIVDGRKQCLNGCLQYSVQGPTKDGEVKMGWWIDEMQLEVVDKGLNEKPIEKKSTGGPMERIRR